MRSGCDWWCPAVTVEVVDYSRMDVPNDLALFEMRASDLNPRPLPPDTVTVPRASYLCRCDSMQLNHRSVPRSMSAAGRFAAFPLLAAPARRQSDPQESRLIGTGLATVTSP